MTEEEAKAWLKANLNVSRETWARLEAYVALLLEEMQHQNLIAESTRDHVWARHIVDSAQLIRLVPESSAASGRPPLWVDLGAGAGLPAIVVAILSGYEVAMIEMRRKRIDFLARVVAELGLSNARVIGGKVEQVRIGAEEGGPAAIISARAYAPLERLIPSALHLTDFSTIWLLPKGQNHKNELAIAGSLWHYESQIEPSLTAPESAILVLKNVRKSRGKRGRSA